jgi:hypothetical protein
MSLKDSQRCIGITLEGKRCNRITARTNLCYQHLEKAQHLKIKKSTLPHAGLGLFTTIRRRMGEKVAPYDGVVVQCDDPGFGGKYVLKAKKNPPTFIDSAVTTSPAGRFSNMAKWGQGGNNAELALWYEKGGRPHGLVRARRDIPKGSEVLTDYGKLYW